jgi:Ras GTPase-activating-like protein IQGAP1
MCKSWYLLSSGLPYEVTQEQALQHAAVRERIEQSIQNLQDATERFLSAILQSVDKIP